LNKFLGLIILDFFKDKNRLHSMSNKTDYKQKLLGIELFEKNSKINVNEISSFNLSYMGDAIFELWCRQKILNRYKNRKVIHNHVVQLVRCQTQAQIANIILPELTPKEKKIYSQGRNSKVISTPKHATVKEYRKASGFECLVGYFFIKKRTKRFEELMKKTKVIEHMESLLNKPIVKNNLH